ncbi:ATP-binding protein [Marinicella sediminis]|uniref:histidine kinase n=1 Tax=Marinicella sediminis TaxID=1792834 RepID=A0ABV7JE67_9GAMM|nr:HAMP domain-containing sensor histidine kinase [Marinicella sediminis]
MINQWQAFWPQGHFILWLVCATYLLLQPVILLINASWQRSPWLLVTDLLVWGLFFAVLGGVSNPLIWCLLLPSVLSALSQTPGFTWCLTVLANLVYGGLWKLAAHHSVNHHHDTMMAEHITGMWLGFVGVSLLMTWVTTTLMRRIHEKNAALLALEKRQQADENLLKMATLATGLAHELGTPLSSIRLLVETIRQEGAASGLDKDMALLDTQVKRCKQVLERLTSVADKTALVSAEQVAVKPWLEDMLAEQPMSSLDVIIEVDNNEPMWIKGDDLLQLALKNIIQNSVAAHARHLSVVVKRGVTDVTLTFTDDGDGQSYHNTDGLGMGLKLSSRIISGVGGSLDFQAMDQGACTVVVLPLSDE